MQAVATSPPAPPVTVVSSKKSKGVLIGIIAGIVLGLLGESPLLLLKHMVQTHHIGWATLGKTTCVPKGCKAKPSVYQVEFCVANNGFIIDRLHLYINPCFLLPSSHKTNVGQGWSCLPNLSNPCCYCHHTVLMLLHMRMPTFSESYVLKLHLANVTTCHMSGSHCCVG